jgi:hypothetical protein
MVGDWEGSFIFGFRFFLSNHEASGRRKYLFRVEVLDLAGDVFFFSCHDYFSSVWIFAG